MTGTDERILMYLVQHGGARVSDVGQHLWGRPDAGKGQDSHSWNKYCRSAGKALNRLERRQCVRCKPASRHAAWYLTWRGASIAGQLLAAVGGAPSSIGTTPGPERKRSGARR